MTHLCAFLAEEQERRPAVSSQARTTAALKCFFRFLVEEERLLRDPARPLRTPKKPEMLPDVLTMDELERLLAQPGRTDLWERHFPGKPERDRLLLALMAYGGLRRGELVGLDWDDVDLTRRLLRVRKRRAAAADDPDPPGARALIVATTKSASRSSSRPCSWACKADVSRSELPRSSPLRRGERVNERKRVTPHTLGTCSPRSC